MTLQTGVGVDINYSAEASFGVAASSAGGSTVRKVSSSLNLGKDTYQSNEQAAHAQVKNFRHGVRRVNGDILQGELSLTTYDDFIEAVTRGTWATGAQVTEADLTNVVSDAATKTFTFGGGDLLAEGFKVGDVVQFTGLTAAGNNGKNLRITALTATTMTVADTIVTDATPDASFTLRVMGSKVFMPTAKADLKKRSFSIEQRFDDVDFSRLFTGVRVGRMALQLPPTGIMTVTFGGMGKDMQILEGANSPYFSAPAEATGTDQLAAVDGFLRVGGSDVAVVTGLNIDVNLNLSSQPVVGSNTVPEVFYGRSVVTGSVTALVDGPTLLKNFVDEDEIELQAFIGLPGGSDFLSVFLPRLKFTNAEMQLQGEQGLPINLPFQALLRDAASSYDETTMVVQSYSA